MEYQVKQYSGGSVISWTKPLPIEATVFCTSFKAVGDGLYACIEQSGENEDFFLISISESVISSQGARVDSIPVVDIYRWYLQNELAFYKTIGEELVGDGVETHLSIGQFQFVSWQVSKPGDEKLWAYLILLLGNTMLKVGVQPGPSMLNSHQRARAKLLTVGLSIIGRTFDS